MSIIRMLVLAAVAAAAVFGFGRPAEATDQPRVLLYSGSTGYRHASIEAGAKAIETLGAREGIAMVASEDPDVFSSESLKGFDAIIFLSSTTDPNKPESEWFTGERRQALQDFVHRGGGIVGIHAAADSHYHWPWFGKLMGGHFDHHPKGTPEGKLHVESRANPATTTLPETIERADEWYYFADYDPTAQLLITIDPQSIDQDDVNANPVSWAREFEGGRVFYTAMGHTVESYSEPYFLDHLAGGLKWVLRK